MAEPGFRIPFRRRSRAIAWAKVLLPLAALALLSTMFLLARAPAGPDSIPFARLEEIAREPRIDRPRLSGVAPDGTTVTLSADRLTPLPGREDVYAVAAPRLETRTPGGGTATLTAGTGEVDGPARRLRLAGGVRVEASPATAVETPEVTADLSTGTAITGPVTGTAPFGAIEAGWLALEAGDGAGAARLLFDGGVRLLYHPQVTAEGP
ncbi:LPS export ABC transporter periplasmic protein LptC [Rubellimicrobium aerolatum]|uniref:LPS export ABC transporter periplasmic protein LptC n=1 Tax=Rubellimicrobium aerolatum TaxID=490979 RepID=A0ABW0SAC8_9RHOB|nr:LPS export ABC transporter periplasmic protein LptC [Rubellimicrobium aerolatum]MBP1805223.1 lipopolysaccharide export system protein LptC [Rubellimicrobium aerolatum]